MLFELVVKTKKYTNCPLETSNFDTNRSRKIRGSAGSNREKKRVHWLKKTVQESLT